MPKQDVVSLKEDIRRFYVSGENSGVNVIQSWFLNQSGTDLSVIVISTITLLILLSRLLLKKVSLSNDYVTIIGVAVFGIVFMYMNSPSLRYGAAFFLAAILVSVKSFKLKGTSNKYGFYVFDILILFTFLKENWFHPWHFTKHIAQRFLLPYPLVLTQKKEFAYFLIDKKIKCYYPIGSNQCFDYELPCASRRMDGIHLRGEGIEQGFYRNAE